MFVDNVDIYVASGKGGAGAVSFRREKYVIQGGPDGGDGGDGGDLYFEVSNNTDTLSKFRGAKYYRAQNGQPGLGKRMSGKSGEDMVVIVPPGTQVFDCESGELLLDLHEVGQRVCFLRGGKGGLGNFHFKSSTNQRPTYAQPGIAGEERHIRLELKLIADVGLVGFPNVGKSTLISTLSNVRPEVANYEFTTLIPSLGVVDVDEFNSFVMADIPGIIDGASEGRGLGLEFLRHIERTKMLLFVIDLSHYREPIDQFTMLQDELAKFSHALSLRPFAIVFSKIDALSVHEAHEKIAYFLQRLGIAPLMEQEKGDFAAGFPVYIKEREPAYQKSGNSPHNSACFIMPISSIAHKNIKPLKYLLHTHIKECQA